MNLKELEVAMKAKEATKVQDITVIPQYPATPKGVASSNFRSACANGRLRQQEPVLVIDEDGRATYMYLGMDGKFIPLDEIWNGKKTQDSHLGAVEMGG